MTVLNREITNAQVIPVVESKVFQDHPEARFAMGIIAVGSCVEPDMEDVFRGYLDLRRKVYVDQTGQLLESELTDGVDIDPDDARSVHFAGLEQYRKPDGELAQRVVAAIRLIVKGSGSDKGVDRPLPVEEFYPKAFRRKAFNHIPIPLTRKPAPSGSLEASRLISRHERAGAQKILRNSIYATALAYIDDNDLGPIYAVIEPWLETSFKANDVPVERLGKPRYIEHYQDYNLPAIIERDKFVSNVESMLPGSMAGMAEDHRNGRMTYSGKVAPVPRTTGPKLAA